MLKKGHLIIVNNDAGISKIPVSSLTLMNFDEKILDCINPYNLSSYFVVATDCIVGIIFTLETGKYIELKNTKDILKSTINEVQYTEPQCGRILRHQAFILPEDNRIEGLSEYYDKNLACECLPNDIIKSLETYGIYI